jgi:hypothetical protein
MPKRSTKKTDERQRRAAERYARARGLMLEPAPGGSFAPIDFVLRDPKTRRPEEVIEVKCRDNGSTAYPTVWAEERKVRALTHWSGIYECPGLFVVEWADGEMRAMDVESVRLLSGHPVRRERVGRDDALDSDMVYLVPVERMERIP